jgi:ubiquinol-cytochrome c reductase cytochrome c1 subunit
MPSRLKLTAAALLLGVALVGPAAASEGGPPLKKGNFSFEGVFGTFDRAALQRGFQVYKEVCASCHSLSLIAYRNLGALGFSEPEVKAIAAAYKVQDGPNDQGEMYERTARSSDRFHKPFANDQAARNANGGALPPDLSLITKARAGGADYVHSLLVGYENPPQGVTMPPGMFYNLYFPGHQVAMPPPLTADRVQYADGTAATVEQEAKDVSTFLAWASEPELEARHRLGVQAMLFLLLLTGMLYAVKRRIWSDVH